MALALVGQYDFLAIFSLGRYTRAGCPIRVVKHVYMVVYFRPMSNCGEAVEGDC